ncbi:hypothetical protein GCM10010260_53940 [Streptomyces filipinensis]|uniref:ABM domain-containing protein n=1 Tax=Streptomyces filipinensis TaxID=66887 RepID=A0A918MDW8_9ACTN|nr:hypothetical protein [Streptomyces filipinensis]GGV09066.1 hypothetical protein GCM10010260_53940 [Streptomyces filipinensis]
MAILMTAELVGVTTEQYDALTARLQALPGNPLAGCLSHVCVPAGPGLVIYDVWESEQALQKFMGVLMPVAQELGLPPGKAPETVPVHAHWTPER